MADATNPQIELAFDYIQNTGKNIFLTGKAGTGKTTFLHRVRAESTKRAVVVAPTGVAAINAKGMTIHSCFQVPFGPFVPGNQRDLSRQRRFSKKKINLIRSIDLLIIDEISMVRADLLDAIDDVLRRFRDRDKPFGGVQLLMIGDLHQLPPVVRPDDWNMLREHYKTSYFFGSNALQLTDPISIELKHIYRQSDDVFINLLNRVRNNQLDEQVLKTLNSRYIPNFDPPEDAGYITLSSHNKTAQSINDEKLKTLKATSHKFKATIDGEFPEHAYPTELVLEFKIGAQVMFVKNDLAPDPEERRYYNGKIGTIVGFGDEEILVKCPDDAATITVNAADWDNVKYSLNEKTKLVEEEIVGTFSQYPLKLAWAITIHKSQGLTFERAIIDAAAAFAHGQVYVALSRCRSFEGIVLRSKIGYGGVKTDTVVKEYSENAERNAPDQKHLVESKKQYQQSLIRELFNFKKVIWKFNSAKKHFRENERALTTATVNELQTLWEKSKVELIDVAAKFEPWLNYQFVQGVPTENETLQERVKKASDYFFEKIKKEITPAVKAISIATDNQEVGKRAVERLKELEKELFIKTACFSKAKNGFSTQAYIKAVADSEIDFEKNSAKPARKKASPHFTPPKDTPHPKLYIQLVEWRTAKAAKEGIGSFEVLPYSAIREIVKFLPTNSTSLKNIDGFGDVKLKKYGAAIIKIVEKYCTGLGIPSNLSTPAIAELPLVTPKKDTKSITLDLFLAGKNIDEIAKERSLVRGTIEGHMSHFIGLGEIDIFKLIERPKVEDMENYFTKNEADSIVEAKKHFGEKYSYGELRMTFKHWKKQQPAK